MPQRSSSLPADDPRLLRSACRSPATVLARLSFGLLALGMALRLLVFVLDFPVWRDEASLSLNFLEHDYFGLLWQLNYGQIAPLFFLWTEKTVFVLAGPSEFWLRSARSGGDWRPGPVPAAGRRRPPADGGNPCGGLAGRLVVARRVGQLDQAVCDRSVRLGVASLSGGRLSAESGVAEVSGPPCLFRAAGSRSLVPFGLRRRCGQHRFGAGCTPQRMEGAGMVPRLQRVAGGGLPGPVVARGAESHPTKTAALAAYMKQYWSHGFPHGGSFNWLRWTLDAQIHTPFSYPVEFNGCGLMGLALVVLGARSLARQGKRSLVFLCLLPFALHFAAALMGATPMARTSDWTAPSPLLLPARRGRAGRRHQAGRDPGVANTRNRRRQHLSGRRRTERGSMRLSATVSRRGGTVGPACGRSHPERNTTRRRNLDSPLPSKLRRLSALAVVARVRSDFGGADKSACPAAEGRPVVDCRSELRERAGRLDGAGADPSE